MEVESVSLLQSHGWGHFFVPGMESNTRWIASVRTGGEIGLVIAQVQDSRSGVWHWLPQKHHADLLEDLATNLGGPSREAALKNAEDFDLEAVADASLREAAVADLLKLPPGLAWERLSRSNAVDSMALASQECSAPVLLQTHLWGHFYLPAAGGVVRTRWVASVSDTGDIAVVVAQIQDSCSGAWGWMPQEHQPYLLEDIRTNLGAKGQDGVLSIAQGLVNLEFPASDVLAGVAVAELMREPPDRAWDWISRPLDHVEEADVPCRV